MDSRHQTFKAFSLIFLLMDLSCILSSPTNVTRSNDSMEETEYKNDTQPRQPEYPGLGDFLPTMPSLLPGGTTAAIPTLTPAMLWSDLYAFCFTFFYGARKCCIGIIFPPVGIKCEPNEKKRNEI